MPGQQFRTDDSRDTRAQPALISASGDLDAIDITDNRGPPQDRRARLLPPPPTVAVLLPCRNEAATIGKVVRDFRSAIPGATVYVYDNASTDDTAAAAQAAGAVVRYSPVPGKGRVLRQMFVDIDAAIFVVADGDDTYDAQASPAMIATLREHQLDMVIGTRVDSLMDRGAFRRFHRLGNWLLSRSVSRIFGDGSTDMLSGYRVLSRRYVKSFPALSSGFETETEMTVHALELCLPFEDVPTAYHERPNESASKLRTIPDGARILKLILLLCKDYRPLRFFGFTAGIAAALALTSGLLGFGNLHAWTPATFFVAGLSAIALMSLLAGVVLDSLRRSSREIKRMLYLAVHPTHGPVPDRRGGWSPGPAVGAALDTPSPVKVTASSE
jgi:glycosyltransferase involved in cell wall biosynthesis